MKRLSQHLNEQESDIKGFTIIKPGFVKYADEIHKYISDKGFNMINNQQIKLSNHQAHDLYSPHKDKDFYNDLCKYMSSDDCIPATWQYDHSDNPIDAMNKIKDHFRNKYGKDEMKNCMHSSDSLDNVKRESKIVFNK